MEQCLLPAHLSTQNTLPYTHQLTHKHSGHVAATRKTTPGFKLVEKYGVLVGGGATHRMDLSQTCMLKDNHIWSLGSITKAIHMAQAVSGFSSKIEVEVRDFDEAVEACVSCLNLLLGFRFCLYVYPIFMYVYLSKCFYTKNTS